MSVPVPIAIPTSAWASAGASLMPSPTIATRRPCVLEPLDLGRLVLRAAPRRARGRCPPGRRSPRRSAGCRRSPSRPRARAACSSRDRLGRLGLDRVGDRDHSGGLAVDGHVDGRLALLLESFGVRREAATRRSRAPACDGRCRPPRARPSTVAVTPWPDRGLEVLDGADRSMPRSRACRTIASPSGCSERDSAAAASASRRSASAVQRARRPSPPARPASACPVLSSTTVSSLRAVSSASAPRTRMPISAPRPVPTMIAVGVASPSAQGQAMISTATNASIALVKLEPVSSQTANESTRDRDHDGHEARGHAVGEPLDRRLRSLRLLDQADDLGQRRLLADPRGPEAERRRPC